MSNPPSSSHAQGEQAVSSSHHSPKSSSHIEADKSLDVVLVKRMKGSYEQNFRKVNIVSNHFPVRITEDFSKLYIFSVRIDPMIPRDNRQKRKEILKEANLGEFISNATFCGMNIITNVEPKVNQKEINVKEYVVKIKNVKTIDCIKDQKSLLFFLNNRLRNVMSDAGYSQIGRSGKYFNIKYKTQIDDLNMYSGYKANFSILENGFFLRVDSARKIVRNQTVLSYIQEIIKKNSSREREDRRNIVRNQLINQIVQVNYGNGRYHKIEDVVYRDISEEIPGNEKFNMLDYYKTKYNITIQDKKQPLLKIENKKEKDANKETLLVPELCLMTGIPEDFDEFKRKKISEQTILDPSKKRSEIMAFTDEIQKNKDFSELQKLGIRLSRRLFNMAGKSIPSPKISLGQDQRIQQGKEAFFNLFGQPIYACKHNVSVAIIFFRADLRDMIRTFETTSKNLKADFSYEQFKIQDDRNAVDDIKRTIRKIKQQKKHNICLIVIPPHMKSQYKRIKEASLVDNSMVCQVAVQNTLRKKNAQSIATKILLQMIAKRGNTLWVPKSKSSYNDIMLIGLDNSATSNNSNILSTCGTVNSTFTSILTKRTEYKGNEDKFDAMCKSIMEIVDYSVERNGKPPKDIIIFMNSCSGDQVQTLREYFVQVFLEKISVVYKEKAPALQVVMVNTKTSERFFDESGGNVKAGTWINSEIVSKEYDFYMVSQNSNRGTVVPNHYKIVFNNSKMEEGLLAELIFNQCFNYVNWSGSIKIPGILQYAKKSAKFSSEVLESVKLSESLEKCLYFV